MKQIAEKNYEMNCRKGKPSKKAQEEAHERIQDKSRKRQRVYRQRKKLSQNAAADDNHGPSGGNFVTSPERLHVAFKFPGSKFVQLQTRKRLANQRAYWKEKKREQRSRMSSQKKRRI